MVFPVKRVKEELINEFAVSKMDIETFSASAHRISVGIDRKELITVRAGVIEIDIPITTEETTLSKSYRRRPVYDVRFFKYSNLSSARNHKYENRKG